VRVRPSVVFVLLALACTRETPRPDLVVVSIDTLRRDGLRAYDPGAPELPALDAFAAESVRMTRAVSTASWTLPAHASLLTGLYPDRHGATDPRVSMSEEAPTLAERLAAHGYQTAAFVAGGYLRREFGLGRGFELYSQGPRDAKQGVFGEAAAFVTDRRDPRPLLLFVHTYRLHDYFRLHATAVARLPRPPARSPGDYLRCLQGSGPCAPEDWPTLRALYRAELEDLSGSFARLRDALVAAGIWERSVVVVTSDHGEGFEPERGRVHHGGRLHEDQLRIPLLLRIPGVAPRDLETPVSLVDVTPTLLELAGAPLPPDLDGRSLVASLRGGSDGAARPLYALDHYYSWWGGPVRMQARTVQARPLSTAVIEGDRWYLRSGRSEEVYDLAADPAQAHDLAARAQDLAALRARAAERSGERVHTAPVRADEALREQLEALGYAQ
jgi:arylsulfatase A-like enzyme